jgi:hypothetical protein
MDEPHETLISSSRVFVFIYIFAFGLSVLLNSSLHFVGFGFQALLEPLVSEGDLLHGGCVVLLALVDVLIAFSEVQVSNIVFEEQLRVGLQWLKFLLGWHDPNTRLAKLVSTVPSSGGWGRFL